jgi:hypothetical protein
MDRAMAIVLRTLGTTEGAQAEAMYKRYYLFYRGL